MNIATGQIIWFVICGIVFVFGAIILYRGTQRDRPDISVGLVVVIVAVLLAGLTCWGAQHRQDGFDADHDLTQQGFTVLKIDTDAGIRMNYSNAHAMVQGPGGCIVKLELKQYIDGWHVVSNNTVISPHTLKCA